MVTIGSQRPREEPYMADPSGTPDPPPGADASLTAEKPPGMAAPPAAGAPAPDVGLDTEFKRGLGLFDATMVVVGSMIGSGIFIVSAEMGQLLGSPGWLLVAWGV